MRRDSALERLDLRNFGQLLPILGVIQPSSEDPVFKSYSDHVGCLG